MIIEPGTKLQNRYEILKELGRGGMGSVFKAHDPLLDRVVAIKTLLAALSADDSFIQRFQHEARAIARLNHPGIVGIFDVGQEAAVSFIVMEFIAGGSLADLLQRENPLPPARVVALLSQIAVALDFAHTRGFVHRDIKPANILLDEEGKTRITDFGLVKMEDINLTLPGQVMGTPVYMAPEQIVGEDVGAAADIYSLGIVAYEMLGGAPPFTGGMSAVFDGHVRRDPPALRQLNPNLPEGVEPIIQRALAKKPEDRFRTAEDFAASLRHLFAPGHPMTIATPPPFAIPASGVAPTPISGPPTPVSGPHRQTGHSSQMSQPSQPSQPPAASVPPAAPPEPPKKKGTNLLAILGGVGALVFLCFCLAVGLLMFSSRSGGEPTAVAQSTAIPSVTPDNPPIPLSNIDEPDEPNELDEPEEPENDARINNLEEVRRAVIQIEAQGSFVDPQFGLQQNQAGRGSGFIIDESGLAVTNNHVVTGAALLRVYVQGENRPRSARVLGVSECYDLAVIQIDGGPLPALGWYDGEVDEGLSVHAAGFPLGEPEYTLTSGVILSADADGVSDWAALDFVLAHNARIQPGNSGGPLVADNGRLVGVNYASASARNEYFAIARTQAIPIIDQLRQGRDIFAIGINGVAVNDGAGTAGIWVSSVKAGSPADQAGVRPGDIITAMQGLLLAQDGAMGDYCAILRSHGPEDTLSLEVVRLETNEILVGQINGRVLETKSMRATLDQTMEDNTAASYDSYINYISQSEIITVDLPAVWNDISDGSWRMGDDLIGSFIAAAADQPAFYDSWDEPGFFLGASRSLIQTYDENAYLDDMVFDASCVYDDRYAYSDPLYTGYYDLWVDCGDNDTIFFVLAATPEDRSFLILIQVVITSNADIEALEKILDSFVVSASLP